MSTLKGASNTIFSILESRTRRNTNEIHKSFVLPQALHRAVDEIAFLENAKVKDVLAIAIGKMIERLEGLNASDEAPLSFAFDPEEKVVPTSAFLSKDLIYNLKKVSHYSGVDQKVIIAYGLADYLIGRFKEKYPDLVHPLEKYSNINKA